MDFAVDCHKCEFLEDILHRIVSFALIPPEVFLVNFTFIETSFVGPHVIVGVIHAGGIIVLCAIASIFKVDSTLVSIDVLLLPTFAFLTRLAWRHIFAHLF